ncbi:MAG: hypothetical protein RIF39_16315 [Cyclobacteriaceae bacterium]
MDSIIKKKLNLLIRLAKADGEFHRSEQKMIQAVAQEAGVDVNITEQVNFGDDDFSISENRDRVHVLYLTLKLILADDVVTNEELSFGREVAAKFSYKPALVDHFVNSTIPDLATFENEIREWVM